MDALEFRRDFLTDIDYRADEAGEGRTAAFISAMAEYMEIADELPEYIPAYYCGGTSSRKCRVDGYYYNPSDFTLTLIIADFKETAGRRVTKSDAEKQFRWLQRFITEAVDGRMRHRVDISHPIMDLIDLLTKQEWDIQKYRLLLFTDAEISSRLKKLEGDPIGGIETVCQIWDINRAYDVAKSESPREKIVVDFAERMQPGLPCLKAPVQNGAFQSYLCIIPGAVLADVYDEYGSQLLEGNVRSFLSVTRKANKDMRQTIKTKPEMFLAYNNGIAATARSIDIKSESGGLFITKIHDLQVINGGQTTASLSNTRFKDKADLDGISVQMKLTVIDTDDQSAATELIQNISRSSNSQTKVSESDFAALHPFHNRMEEISRRISAPAVGGLQHGTKWFYERAAGQYMQAQMRMSKAEKDRFTGMYPKNQKITKTDFAKYRNSWEGHPDTVSKGAQTNFTNFSTRMNKTWVDDNTGFNEKYFKDTVAIAILFKAVEKLISRQPWYEGGYRANIVTYTLSLLPVLIKNQFPDFELDLQRIWQNQAVDDLLLQAVTQLTYDVLTEIKKGSGGKNVTQWCKKPECWTRVKSISYALPENLKGLLISTLEVKRDKKDARKDQKLISDFQCLEIVLQRSAEEWKELQKFAYIHHLLKSEWDITALRYAMHPTGQPTPKQARRLLELWDEAVKEGFQPQDAG